MALKQPVDTAAHADCPAPGQPRSSAAAGGLVQRLLSHIEVTQQPDQRRQHAARFGL
jgi:hypothetical protein